MLENVNWEMWAPVIAVMLTAVIMFVVHYLTTKDLLHSFVEGLGQIAGSLPTVNALEGLYTDVMPDEWEPVISSVIEALQRKAEGTATEADDALLDLLSRITDGKPNA